MTEILIVEDDADLVETYRDLLESHGHSVIHAAYISEAKQCLVKTHPRIITLDLNLPGSSSAQLTDLMRTAKASGETKIIVVSGHPEMIAGVEWVNDIDLILTKPVDNHQLLKMIDRLLQ